MKTKLIFLLAGLLLLIAPANLLNAQVSGGLGFYKPGIHTIKFSSLNSSLPTGSPVLTNRPFVSAGAGYGIFSNFVIGGEGGTLHGGSFTRDNQVIDLSGSYGFFSLGYVLINKKGLLMYPLLSIGDNDLDLYFHQKDQTASFSTITGEPFQSVTLHYKTRMLKASVAGVYVLKGSKNDNGAGGLMIGLEAGYQISYKTGVWDYDNGAVTGGPDFNNNAFFIQLMIGGGGVASKK